MGRRPKWLIEYQQKLQEQEKKLQEQKQEDPDPQAEMKQEVVEEWPELEEPEGEILPKEEKQMDSKIEVKTTTQTKEEANIIPAGAVEKVKFLFPDIAHVPDNEIIKALLVCRELNLNPLKREVHFVPIRCKVKDAKGNVIGERLTLQLVTSYTQYLKRAEQSGKLDGWQLQFGWDEQKKDKYAEVTIWRKDWNHPFVWRTYLREVKRGGPLWEEREEFMHAKNAIAIACRLCFPCETAELPYEEAEILSITDREELKPKEEKRWNGSSAQNVKGKELPKSSATVAEEQEATKCSEE